MKRCPRCHQTYAEEALKFCRDDGARLQDSSVTPDENADTRMLSASRADDGSPTQLLGRGGSRATAPGATLERASGADTGEIGAPRGVPRPASAAARAGGIKRQKIGAAIIIFGALALTAGALSAWIYTSPDGGPRRAPVSFQSAKFSRVTNTGKVAGAAISPDGKYVAHVVDEGGQQSLWVRQAATASNVQIVPPAEVSYRGLTFSPDGDYVYYTLFGRDERRGELYQVPALGGAGRKLLAGINSAVTFSPDGKQMAFIRRSIVGGAREDALVTANADGTGERILATKSKDERLMRGAGGFSGPSWSPDGKTIACPFGNTLENSMTVAAVSVDSGEARAVTNQKWFAVRQVAWLADGDSILLNAQEHSVGAPYQLWQVSAATGEARRVTNDLTNYRSFSVSAGSDTIAAIAGEALSNIWVMPAADSARAEQVTFARANLSDVTWTHDGRLVYLSNAAGSVELYLMDARGGDPKQLTANSRSNRYPSVTRDGRYVVYMSDRTGRPNVWRMDLDGGNQKQLTDGVDLYPYVSPDGRWVVYQSWDGEARVRKVPIDGGQFVQLTDYLSGTPVASPDGRYIACTYQEQTGAPIRLGVISPEGGPPLKSFPLPGAGETDTNVIRWAPDGREIVYSRTTEGVSNLWAQPVDGGQPKQLTNFTADRIFWFDYSHDGKRLALARGQLLGDVVLIRDFR